MYLTVPPWSETSDRGRMRVMRHGHKQGHPSQKAARNSASYCLIKAANTGLPVVLIACFTASSPLDCATVYWRESPSEAISEKSMVPSATVAPAASVPVNARNQP